MTKPIPKAGSRRNGRSSARKSARRIPKGVIHVQTNVRGRVISWSSIGTCGFKVTIRGTPFDAQTATRNAIRAISPGLGRDATLRAIRRSGILLSFVRDVTPMPHNGCRPPKKRRV
ncbi:hypothetical protein V6Z11_A01G150800 [Gossypium hirsutum]